MIARRPVTKAVAKLLTEAVGRPCGPGVLPRTGTGPVPPPYTVLHPAGWTVQGAPMSDLSEDASAVYQVVCVAESTDQAEWLADRARAGVLERDPSTGLWRYPLDLPAGVICRGRSLDVDVGTDPVPGDGIVDYMIRFRFDLTTRTMQL
ncbi:hypothetical protein ACIF6L_34725 [Kitasatospora sp. NPDC086009]|uniref:hypothetical protein n=1 Tax=unclassified Kitasatospora TaxID=2633591 RepID=UPI0037CBDB50